MSTAIDNLNFARDVRNCERDRPPVLYLEDGGEMELPTTWAVCSVCRGAGTHVNPSIDSGGLSAEHLDDDPDFAEDYFGGVYDVPCNRCGGRTTERVVGLEALTKTERELYTRQLRDDADCRAMQLAEIAAGA